MKFTSSVLDPSAKMLTLPTKKALYYLLDSVERVEFRIELAGGIFLQGEIHPADIKELRRDYPLQLKIGLSALTTLIPVRQLTLPNMEVYHASEKVKEVHQEVG